MYGMSVPGGELKDKNLDHAGKQLLPRALQIQGHTCLKSIEEATITSSRKVMRVS